MKLYFGLIAMAATAVLGLSRIEFPTAKFWNNHHIWLLVCIGYLTVFAGYESLAGLYASRRKEREKALDAARTIVRASFLQIVENPGLDWKKVGLHVFQVVKRRRRLLLRYEVQEEIARFQLSAKKLPSIRFTKDKGVIGRCWREVDKVTFNSHAEFSTLRDLEIERCREAFGTLPEASRGGLTFAEFWSSRNDYGAIVAVPIISDDAARKYLGCVSCDAEGDSYAYLASDRIFRALEECAAQIRDLVLGE